MKKEISPRRRRVERIVFRAVGFFLLGYGGMFLTFLALFSGDYYLSGVFYYRYASESLFREAKMFLLWLLILLAVILLGALFLVATKSKMVLKICVAAGLLGFILCLPYASCVHFLDIIFEVHGCSYTEDIANYGSYDEQYGVPSHFPAEITEEMTVTDFSYYYKYNDVSHFDQYLEVRFENRETMERYLNQALEPWGTGGTVSYPNPYDAGYTDVLFKDDYQYSYVQFDGPKDRPTVRMRYAAVCYSYEELTVIYTDTRTDTQMMLGNDPDRGVYTPRYLLRFGAEWDEEYSNSFEVEDLVTQA